VYAARVMPGENELGRARARQHAALEPLQVLRGDAEVLRRLGDLSHCLRLQRLALVEGQQVSQLIASLLDGLGDAVQPPGPLESLETGHVLARSVRRLDRMLRVG